MRIAFTGIPEGLDVANLVLTKHARLFRMGIDENTFDQVAGHLVATLKNLGVPSNLIDEVVGVVGPLRPVFAQGRKVYSKPFYYDLVPSTPVAAGVAMAVVAVGMLAYFRRS